MTQRIHPLRAWRETQRRIDHRSKKPKTWSIADAARAFSVFCGREVAYQTWMAWERFEDEAGSRRPDGENMRQLFFFTGGHIRPDHFHDVASWRGKLRDQREAAANDQREAALAEAAG